MRIKTITCHRVYNYGASLQAYALQHYVESLGHQVEIIDFWPSFFQRRYNFSFVSKDSRFYKFSKRLPILRYVFGPIVNRSEIKTIGRKKSFDRFEKKYLNITDKRYLTSESLKQIPPKADVYIAGSDQIWNTDMPNGYEDAFYLDFGDNKTKKITYAASFGITAIPELHKGYVREKCKELDEISVRESSGVTILKECGITDVTHVLDPVFLLSKEEWLKLTFDSINYNLKRNQYILLYEFIGDDAIKQVALECAKHLGYKIVSVNDFISQDYADSNVKNAGPCEFISLINNAALVITNSFHATAFSIILNKNFYAYSLASQKTSGRMADICHLLGIDNRFNNFNPDCDDINYLNVNKILSVEIEKSQAFLKNSL